MSEPSAGSEEATLASVGQTAALDTGPEVAEPERGVAIGRYVVLDRVGAGAMGVVYAAYDPELDRKVAIKLLRTRGGQARLLREAQALARLTHPNVVTVHDAGTYEGRVWLAMEHMSGRTLAQWRRDVKPAWREVVDVLTQAGRGLAAAHAAGLVHRDFKPDNVMISDDGAGLRVRVMDFGLARARTESSVSGERERPRREIPVSLATRAGAVQGTPAYMAPEQIGGEEVGPAADQFGYCVTAWEALFGERPFAGPTLVELSVSILEGRIRPPTASASVPAWLRRCLERGLSADPSDRWPSIDQLLLAMQHGRTRARSRRLWGVIALFALGAGSFAAWKEIDRRRETAACEAEGASIREVWNDEERAEVERAMLATGVGSAASTIEKALPWLDTYAEGWEEARTNACMDATVDEVSDSEPLEQARWCLDVRRMELEWLVTRFTSPTRMTLLMAVNAAVGLSPLAPCGDADALRRLPIPPVERRNDIAEALTDLTRAIVLRRTAAFQEGLVATRDVVTRAEALAWPPLTAKARIELAIQFAETAEYEASRRELEAAYFEAARAGDNETAGEAARLLGHVLGVVQPRSRQALVWVRHAEAMRWGAPDPGRLREADLIGVKGRILRQSGAIDDGCALTEQALAIEEATLGPEHPELGVLLNDLAACRIARDDYTSAMTLHERAIAIRENAFGPDHPEVARSLNNVARTYYVARAWPKAIAAVERANKIFEVSLGSDHPDFAASLGNLARLYSEVGDEARAKVFALRGLEITQRRLGNDHPSVGQHLEVLGGIHASLGEYVEARAVFERALGIHERTLGREHPEVGLALVALARLCLAQGRPADAVPLAERVLAMRVTVPAGSETWSHATFALARALWESGGRSERQRSVRLAEDALASYEKLELGTDRHVDEVRTWLDARRRARAKAQP